MKPKPIVSPSSVVAQCSTSSAPKSDKKTQTADERPELIQRMPKEEKSVEATLHKGLPPDQFFVERFSHWSKQIGWSALAQA